MIFFSRKKKTSKIIKPLFNGVWYLNKYPDVKDSGMTPLEHYIEHGGSEGRKPNPLFDGVWYLNKYPDVKDSGMNPLAHYIKYGSSEGRKPNQLFDGVWYLNKYPDVKDSGMNPLEHYIRLGAVENRSIGNLRPEVLYMIRRLVLNHLVMDPSDQIIALARKIKIPTSSFPKVSIIIPVYGKLEYTIQCLDSIEKNLPNIEFEVIVVDDCSKDDSTIILPEVKGIRYFKNDSNLGFIGSCNHGAAKARGQYLCFLNNDTEVLPRWLDELVKSFEYFPSTGLVGSKLIYPDGALQEAGGIIWNDGSAWNFGRNQDSFTPEYNYAREVDYCSGASIAVPKNLFDELGGFDSHFAPAYCEDCDFALKVRTKGYRVIYQPLSVVIHHEGISSGTDTSQGVKAYQIENTKKLYERWKDYLSSHQSPGMEVDRAKDRRAKKRVLIVDQCTLTPNQDAGSLLIFNLILLFREMEFQPTFIPEHTLNYDQEYSPVMQGLGIEVLYPPYIENLEQHLRKCGERYDLVVLVRPGSVDTQLWNVRKFCPKAKVIFHTVDLHFQRMLREAKLQQDSSIREAAFDTKKLEFAAMRAVDASIVVSTTERELLSEEDFAKKIYVLPLILPVVPTNNDYSTRKNIVFVGGFQHMPNVDAVIFFVKEVMPILRKKITGVKFHIVGSKAPQKIMNLGCEDVVFEGFVEQLNPYLDKMRISVAPLRFGAGIKGKVASSMCVGLPVVATTLAVEGMELNYSENCLIADDPNDFAQAVTNVYMNEELWNKISQNSLLFAEESWGAISSFKKMASLLGDLGFSDVEAKYPLSLFVEKSSSKTSLVQSDGLKPVGTAINRSEFEQIQLSEPIQLAAIVESELSKSMADGAGSSTFAGFCMPCKKDVLFVIDMEWGGEIKEGRWIPNWRERLVCPICQMNNRQRLICSLIEKEIGDGSNKSIYFMEQVTPIYQWAVNRFTQHRIVGSEYLGFQYDGGKMVDGIRHENIESLSFIDSELDIIVSNDVLEHVPNPHAAFSECARVLKSGGVMLSTIPFHSNEDKSEPRAFINSSGNVENVMPAQYHGNPMLKEGSLVFTDFGWDILDVMYSCGFSKDSKVAVYSSVEYGHLGGGQVVFRLSKD